MIDGELQKSVCGALVAAGVAGGRIYDEPPADAVFPYCVIGDEQDVDDGTDCQDGWEVFIEVHVWSRPSTGSFLEAKGIAKAVVASVRAITAVTGYTLVQIDPQQTLYRRDPEGDGKTRQAICQFRALIDPA